MSISIWGLNEIRQWFCSRVLPPLLTFLIIGHQDARKIKICPFVYALIDMYVKPSLGSCGYGHTRTGNVAVARHDHWNWGAAWKNIYIRFDIPWTTHRRKSFLIT